MPMCPSTHTTCTLYVLTSPPWTDGSPKLIQNLSEHNKGLNGCLTVTKNTDVPTCAVLSYILQYTSLKVILQPGILWCGRSPRPKLCPLLQPNLYTPSTIAFIGLEPAYQTRPPWISSLNLFCHSLDCEWLVACISQYHPVSPHL